MSDWFSSLSECLLWNVRKRQKHWEDLEDELTLVDGSDSEAAADDDDRDSGISGLLGSLDFSDVSTEYGEEEQVNDGKLRRITI